MLSRSASVSALVAAVLAAGCLGIRLNTGANRAPQMPTRLTLAGQFSLPPLERFPPSLGLPFGGISGLATRSHGDLLGISDAQRGGRIYRFRIEGLGAALRITPIEVIPLEAPSADALSDHEAIVALPNGNYLIASEGTGREPRRPPSIEEYGSHGSFVRQLPIRDRYVPEPTGAVTRGARGNAGFESLTASPDFDRLFTATETALIQDGPTATFDAGTQSRILEYVAHGGTFRPAREFVYNVEPVDKPAFKPGVFINGLVELLALNRTTLLALERGYVENPDDLAASMNRIRVYRISLDGATDVSSLDSLKGHPDVRPVEKTVLMDLTTVSGLSPDLAPSLDNFEGMAFGPRLPDGRASLILVSDDNFRATQRTWFLVFAIE